MPTTENTNGGGKATDRAVAVDSETGDGRAQCCSDQLTGTHPAVGLGGFAELHTGRHDGEHHCQRRSESCSGDRQGDNKPPEICPAIARPIPTVTMAIRQVSAHGPISRPPHGRDPQSVRAIAHSARTRPACGPLSPKTETTRDFDRCGCTDEEKTGNGRE